MTATFDQSLHLTLDQSKVLRGQQVNAALEGQRPELGRPAFHVEQSGCELIRVKPFVRLQINVDLQADAPGVVVRASGRN